VKDIAVVGCGKIGLVIADLLAHSGDYRVTVIDRSAPPRTVEIPQLP
jgi:saccharopine dehydrogenase-like NADP-dependent oxidoreductase